MSMFALNISAHLRCETRSECKNVVVHGRGRESEIREWNVWNNPGDEVKVKVVSDSASLTHCEFCSPAYGHRHHHLRLLHESQSETKETCSIGHPSNITEHT